MNPETETDPSGNCPWCIAAVVGAIAGAAISYGSQVASNVQHGGSLTDGSTWTHVDGGAILKAALIGAVIGATGGAAGAAVAGGIGALGLSGGVAVAADVGAGAALGAAEGAGGQVLSNVANGQQWSDGVGQAALFGAATGGAGAAAGMVLRRRSWGEWPTRRREPHARCRLRPTHRWPPRRVSKRLAACAVGDTVTAYDPTSGKTSTQTVQHVFLNHDSDLLDVTLASGGHERAADCGDGHDQQGAAGGSGEPWCARASDGRDQHDAPPASETVHTTEIHPWLTAIGVGCRRASCTWASGWCARMAGRRRLWGCVCDQEQRTTTI